MTVFVAGVHGVGKSYLCQQYEGVFTAIHESASGLIRKERALVDWSVDKKVSDIDSNQAALCRAVERICSAGKNLLLDGHFVLIGERAEFLPIDVSVFESLSISGVVLIEAEPALILSRLAARDLSKSVVDVSLFVQAERLHARAVCDRLDIPLYVLHEPDFGEFSQVVSFLFESAQVE
jgi:adenylate kinase